MIHILLTDAALVIKFKLTYEQTIKDNIVLFFTLVLQLVLLFSTIYVFC